MTRKTSLYDVKNGARHTKVPTSPNLRLMPQKALRSHLPRRFKSAPIFSLTQPRVDCGTEPEIERLTNSYDKANYRAKHLNCLQMM